MSTAAEVLTALQPYNLRKEGHDRYRFNSPFRPNSDSMSCTLIINSPEHGSFFDHHPSANPQSGSLYELARHLGIALPAVVPVENTKRAYTGLEDYACTHGLSGDVLRVWQWREVTFEGRPALEFPTPSGLRWRFLDGAKGKPVYKSIQGYTRCWYGFSVRLKELLREGKPLVICNGEISTVAGQHHGVPAVAMTSGEKGEIPGDLLEQLKGFLVGLAHLKIIIALDCDKAGRAAARGLEAQLRREGFEVRAVDLGLGQGGDLADFCMLHAPNVLHELDQCPTLSPAVEATKWQFASVDDVLQLQPINWLVARQIPARGLVMIYGASGTYKSFFILMYALQLALEGSNVLYIAAEGEYGYRQQLEAWIKHHQVKPTNITFVLGQVDLFDVEELEEFNRLISVYQPRMIVVDTFAMCSGMADENSSRDILTIVNGCKLMSRHHDAAIVVIHHTNAEGKKERGSKALRNACDTIIRLSLDDDLIVVQSQKTKDTKPFETYFLAPVTIDLGYKNNLGEDVTSVVLLPADKVIQEADLTPNQRQVLQVLSIQPNTSVTEISQITEIDNSGSVSRAIGALRKKGYLQILPNGNRELTKAGLQALNVQDAIDSPDLVDQQN